MSEESLKQIHDNAYNNGYIDGLRLAEKIVARYLKIVKNSQDIYERTSGVAVANCIIIDLRKEIDE